MLKITLSVLSFLALMTNASNTVRRLLQIPSTGVAGGQPIVPAAGVAAGAGYGVMPGFGGAATMGNGAVVPGYGAPAMGAGNGAVVPGYGTAPGYGMAGNGPQNVVPYGGAAMPAGHWVWEPLYPGQFVPNGGVMPKYEQPGSEGRR